MVGFPVATSSFGTHPESGTVVDVDGLYQDAVGDDMIQPPPYALKTDQIGSVSTAPPSSEYDIPPFSSPASNRFGNVTAPLPTIVSMAL